jgi:HSP20 family protein
MALPTPRPSRQPGALQRRYDPFREMEDVYDRMGQLVQSLFGDPTPGLAGGRFPSWGTLTDIEETDDAYIVELDLPGVRSEDVNVEIRESQLRVSGEYREKERVGVLRRQTRPVGEFDYTVALPGDVDPERVDATLSDGVLVVRIGKSAAAQPRRIEVKGG